MENQNTNKQFLIAKELYQLNQLSHIKLSDETLEEWAKTLIELKKDVSPEWIKKVVNKMKTGQELYDYRLGIRNIFLAFNTTFDPKIC